MTQSELKLSRMVTIFLRNRLRRELLTIEEMEAIKKVIQILSRLRKEREYRERK